MKCDDDTFVRVDAVLNEANKIGDGKSLYVGNINYYHKPLRYGKWSVTYEVPIPFHSRFRFRRPIPFLLYSKTFVFQFVCMYFFFLF